MPDIDWFAVDTVVSGIPMNHLTTAEKRMIVRRLLDKMQSTASMYDIGLTSEQVGRLLGCTSRTVERIKAELPPAEKRTCPKCGEPMWVVGTEVEPHGNRIFEECAMSYSQTRRGLAAIRPDLYRWADEAVSA